MKLKICSSCQKECYLWKSNPKLCKPCAMKEGSKIGNYSITSNKPIQETKIQKSIRNISDKQLARIKEYRKARDEYFKQHPVCEYPGCNSRDVTLHHMGGKIGDMLTNIKYFKSLCIRHHEWVESHPSEAKELGLSVDRLNK